MAAVLSFVVATSVVSATMVIMWSGYAQKTVHIEGIDAYLLYPSYASYTAIPPVEMAGGELGSVVIGSGITWNDCATVAIIDTNLVGDLVLSVTATGLNGITVTYDLLYVSYWHNDF